MLTDPRNERSLRHEVERWKQAGLSIQMNGGMVQLFDEVGTIIHEGIPSPVTDRKGEPACALCHFFDIGCGQHLGRMAVLLDPGIINIRPVGVNASTFRWRNRDYTCSLSIESTICGVSYNVRVCAVEIGLSRKAALEQFPLASDLQQLMSQVESDVTLHAAFRGYLAKHKVKFEIRDNQNPTTIWPVTFEVEQGRLRYRTSSSDDLLAGVNALEHAQAFLEEWQNRVLPDPGLETESLKSDIELA